MNDLLLNKQTKNYICIHIIMLMTRSQCFANKILSVNDNCQLKPLKELIQCLFSTV